ncbi:HNH endonuclease [Microbacterium phage Footloose]|uniref:HNH endonuclease n=1 Tax=Microbacterium phage Footloose TaxID=2836048 RepID=A0A8F3IM42_9CAUD|nr:HNH endonuclease [Microbacterium phage Footloose]QWY84652.1 HNH endonuclease [Microbacterium phage Footloose]
MSATRPLKERLEEKLDKAGPCWTFTGAIATSGYGRIGVNKRTLQAHRAAYEVFIGPIPDGAHIDHLCRNRRCCNPKHLEAVSQAENNRRAGLVRRANTTHCKRGHEFTDENTLLPTKGGRQCRECHNARSRASRRERGVTG